MADFPFWSDELDDAAAAADAVSAADAARFDALLDAAPLGSDHDLEPVARVLAAAKGPAQQAELAGEQAAIAEFRRRQAGARRLRARLPGRPTTISARLTRRMAACVATGVVGFTGVTTAAYACVLPAPIQSFAHDTIAAPAPEHAHHSGDGAHPNVDIGVGQAATPTRSTAGHRSAAASVESPAIKPLMPQLGGRLRATASPACARVHDTTVCVVCPTAPTPWPNPAASNSDGAGRHGSPPFVCRFPFPGHGFGLAHAPGRDGQHADHLTQPVGRPTGGPVAGYAPGHSPAPTAHPGRTEKPGSTAHPGAGQRHSPGPRGAHGP
jgi:hypothetical protein